MDGDSCDALIDSQHAVVPPENLHRPETQRLTHLSCFHSLSPFLISFPISIDTVSSVLAYFSVN